MAHPISGDTLQIPVEAAAFACSLQIWQIFCLVGSVFTSLWPSFEYVLGSRVSVDFSNTHVSLAGGFASWEQSPAQRGKDTISLVSNRAVDSIQTMASIAKTRRSAKNPARAMAGRTPAVVRRTRQTLQTRLDRLHQQLREGFHRNALKTCNRLLVLQNHQDHTLVEIKAKLLTVLERYDEAIDFLSAHHTNRNPELKLLESYCLYKLSKLQEASVILSDPIITANERLGRAKLALESQIFFKLERYQEAKSHLEELLLDCDPNHPEYHDLTANLSECQARLDFLEQIIPREISSIDVHQLESTPITSSFFNSHPHFSKTINRPLRPPKARPSKPPKPLDPTRPPPDPDRWLPRHEKQGFKPSKRILKAIKAKQKLTTQGSIGSAPPPQSSSQSSRKNKQINSKKKGKGKNK
ncbi:hypothetical protein O181_072224 [Austropuccinia psidii MF-1]|uniref:Signal recognition particle subunit SRP72 n=1 Tax=Austropuccinia psidii MF-1 TaxID=1389203 RepID=A0A9Q3IBA1_9BASI|nr:hypothetical protein [Austropuccinia psidii MF-1]